MAEVAESLVGMRRVSNAAKPKPDAKAKSPEACSAPSVIRTRFLRFACCCEGAWEGPAAPPKRPTKSSTPSGVKPGKTVSIERSAGGGGGGGGGTGSEGSEWRVGRRSALLSVGSALTLGSSALLLAPPLLVVRERAARPAW